MQIKWTRPAANDLQEAFAYILQEDPQAALQTVERIEQSVQYLGQHPRLGRIGTLPDTRELIVPQTPYFVAYRIRGNIVEILAIVHMSKQWPSRV
jgi:toxin ParE1/3/4